MAAILGLAVALLPFLPPLQKILQKRRKLRKALGQLRVGMPSRRVYDMLVDDPIRAEDLSRSDFVDSDGRNEFFEFRDADVQVVFESDVLEVFSIRTKNAKCPVTLRGRGAIPESLTAGRAKFSDIPLREVTHCEFVHGARPYMNWYLELRPGRSESDPNVWLYGWKPSGIGEMNHALVPPWYEGWLAQNGYCMDTRKLTVPQQLQLAAFRATLPINSIVALRHENDAKRFDLSGLF